MENSDQYDELLVRFLLDELDAEEEAKVLAWINLKEQNSRYYEELEKTWRLTGLKNSLKEIDIDNEWRQLEQKVSFKNSEEGQRLTEEVNGNGGRRRTIYKIIVSTAIAASVMFVIGLGFGVFDNHDISTAPQVSTKVSKRNEKSNPFVRHEKNTTGKLKHVVLPDGTKVILANNSEISFLDPFAASRRDITLKGKATFNVAKDKTKAFTVFSGSLSTTALGTKFSVSAFTNENLIVVRLLEGKVVVKTNHNKINRTKTDYYIVVGQELVYNNLLGTATVKRFGENKVVAKSNRATPSAIDSVAIPTYEKGSWFMFNNQSLDKVFDELENMYEVDIEYSKRDLYNKYFIGKFDKKDSLESILEQIATLNNLKVIKKNDKFIIKK